MQPRPIAQAPKTATILANFGNVLCIAKWNPDKGRRPRPFWEPSPRLASPYIESWVRAHQPTEFLDVAEILAHVPTPPPTPAPGPAPPKVITISGAGTLVIEVDILPGEIKQHPKLLLAGKDVPFQVEVLARDATGVRRAKFKISNPSALPAELTFVDSAIAPPPITP